MTLTLNVWSLLSLYSKKIEIEHNLNADKIPVPSREIECKKTFFFVLFKKKQPMFQNKKLY